MCVPGTIETVRASLREEEQQSEQAPLEPPTPRISRRAALAASAGAAFAALSPGPALAGRRRPRRRGRRLQDLTHVYSEDFPLFLGSPRGSRETRATVAEDGFYGQFWSLWEHSATHMDAPAHFVEDGRQSPEIKPRELFGVPVVVVDVAGRASEDPDTVVTPDDLMRFERRHGRIPRRAVVCMYSGWEQRAGSEEAYLNVGADGKQHFPGFGDEAVEWLLTNRRITGIGVDTLSLDHGPSTTFDVHKTLLGANKYGLENLANLKEIPPRGARMFVGLIPWKEGSGGACRVIASF